MFMAYQEEDMVWLEIWKLTVKVDRGPLLQRKLLMQCSTTIAMTRYQI